MNEWMPAVGRRIGMWVPCRWNEDVSPGKRWRLVSGGRWRRVGGGGSVEAELVGRQRAGGTRGPRLARGPAAKEDDVGE